MRQPGSELPGGRHPMSSGRGSRQGSPRERGSIVLFVLFVCLAVAVVVQTLSVVVLCAQRARRPKPTAGREWRRKMRLWRCYGSACCRTGGRCPGR